MKEIKCKKCGKKLSIQEYLEKRDYTRITNDTIEIYCNVCGIVELVKLNRTQEEEIKEGRDVSWI